jgi:uncharacterized protein YjiK
MPAARFAAPTDCAKADAGPARHARVAVGHVGDGFLGVAEDARDAEVFHLRERAPQHCVHEKYVGDAVRFEQMRDEPRALHFFRHR